MHAQPGTVGCCGFNHCVSRRRCARAFTLLEVLVVVAVVALLMAVLLPSLRQVRERTKIVKCQSNLRQIAMACRLYLDANNGYFVPRKTNADINYGGRQGTGSRAFGANRRRPVRKRINPHLKIPEVVRTDAAVFECPSDRGEDEAAPPTYFESHGTSYRANLILIGPPSLDCIQAGPCTSVCQEVNRRLKGLNRSRVSHASRLLLASDFEWYDTWEWNSGEGASWHGRRGYYNVAYLDGHVQFIRIRKGLWVTPDYTVLPFKDLHDDAVAQQEEGPYEDD